MKKFYTCEYVTEGHPDKVCDQIADAVLDECIKINPFAKVAVEAAIKTPEVYVFGEIGPAELIGKLDIEKIVKNTLKSIGYTSEEVGFNADKCRVITNISPQSADIARGVDESKNKELGAGDQGIMYGYATNETESYLPMPFYLSRGIIAALTQARKSKKLKYLRPDGKSQVSVCYDNGKAESIDSVVVSAQHDEGVSQEQITTDVLEHVIMPVVAKSKLRFDRKKVYINPTGKFVIGGPAADSGLTGRKNIVDTYGGIAHHGGGSFSGKDPTKVDRSASYYARYVAKHVVAAGLARKCEISVAYAIGRSEPCMVEVDTFGTSKIDEESLRDLVKDKEVFDFRPANIIKELGLRVPIYAQTARVGHFGVDGYPWEKLTRLADLKKKAGRIKVLQES